MTLWRLSVCFYRSAGLTHWQEAIVLGSLSQDKDQILFLLTALNW